MLAFIGEVRAFPYTYAPYDESKWLICDGSTYLVPQHQALYSIIGTLYGGTPNRDFKVPDLRTRIAVGAGVGPGLPLVSLATSWGSNQMPLTSNEIPSHTHQITAKYSSLASDLMNAPSKDYYISRTLNQFDYSNDPLTGSSTLSEKTLSLEGGGQAHENRQPVTAITFFICYDGEYPIRE
ncbi:MAG: tail fiber protein [Pseudomonadota bacterium]